MKNIYIFIYYIFASKLPTQPVPGWRIGYAIRRFIISKIAEKCGKNIIVKQNAYIGSGLGLRLGDNTQLGANSRIGPNVSLGDNVLMGPDCVIMTTAHAFENREVPIRLQGALPIKPIIIGDDVWIGTRVVILPGVKVGNGAVIGANSVVTKNIEPYAVVGGVPAKFIRWRGNGNRGTAEKS
jgi:maltose O-acetyltransferase